MHTYNPNSKEDKTAGIAGSQHSRKNEVSNLGKDSPSKK